MKIWAVLLSISAIVWAVDTVSILFGYVPNKFSIFTAFVITTGVMCKWAAEEWSEKR